LLGTDPADGAADVVEVGVGVSVGNHRVLDVEVGAVKGVPDALLVPPGRQVQRRPLGSEVDTRSSLCVAGGATTAMMVPEGRPPSRCSSTTYTPVASRSCDMA
jgi:hypothetical protein